MSTNKMHGPLSRRCLFNLCDQAMAFDELKRNLREAFWSAVTPFDPYASTDAWNSCKLKKLAMAIARIGGIESQRNRFNVRIERPDGCLSFQYYLMRHPYTMNFCKAEIHVALKRKDAVFPSGYIVRHILNSADYMPPPKANVFTRLFSRSAANGLASDARNPEMIAEELLEKIGQFVPSLHAEIISHIERKALSPIVVAPERRP